MKLSLKLGIFLVVLLFSLFVLHSVKKGRLIMKYATLWLFASFVLFVGILIPDLLKKIAFLLGFEIISNMVFFGGFVLVTFIIFSLTIIVSSQSRKIKILVQEISILKNELEELKK